MKDLQKAVCAGCGCEGYAADTSAGEIVDNGRVVATVPAGETVLLVGKADGSRTDEFFCDTCAS